MTLNDAGACVVLNPSGSPAAEQAHRCCYAAFPIALTVV
jgi:hypothetical protein